MKKNLWMVLFSVLVLICHSALYAQVEDGTPPAIRSFDFTPTTVDVSGGSQIITFTARITDDLSGVQMGYAYLQSPSLKQGQLGSFDSCSRISGDTHDGVYRFNITIPQYSEAGEWRIGQIYVVDAAGNRHVYDTDELVALGFPTVVTVRDIPDLAPPIIAILSFTPTTVDVSGGSQIITFTARITDDLSGVHMGYVYLQSPSLEQGQLGGFDSCSRISGNINDGIYRFDITIPQYSEAGEWRIGQIYVVDAAGNRHVYDTDELVTLGFPTVVTVSENKNPVADAGPDKTAFIKEQLQFDGSQSSDSDGYITAWVWDFGDGSPTATGTLVLHAYAQPGQFTVILTVTDEKGATAVDQLLVVVKAPATAVADLITEVKSSLVGEIQNSLGAKLDSALDALNKKNDTAAVNKLNAFINEVNAQKGKKIPADIAEKWIAFANRIIASILSGANYPSVSSLGAPVNARMVDRADSLREIDAEAPGFVVRVRAEEAGLIIVAIKDAKGNLVGILSGRSDKAGDYVLLWDGLDREGNPCPKGVYSYQILGSSKPGTRGVIPIR